MKADIIKGLLQKTQGTEENGQPRAEKQNLEQSGINGYLKTERFGKNNFNVYKDAEEKVVLLYITITKK